MKTKTQYQHYFVYNTRQDGSNYYALSDDAPQGLHDTVRDIHFDHFDGWLPADWVYKEIAYAFEALEDNYDCVDNAISELEADCYYQDLDKWFSENTFSHALCNEVLQEFGPWDDIYKLIGCAQVMAKERIYYAVNEFLENNPFDEESVDE